MKRARFDVVNYEKKEADKPCPSGQHTLIRLAGGVLDPTSAILWVRLLRLKKAPYASDDRIASGGSAQY